MHHGIGEPRQALAALAPLQALIVLESQQLMDAEHALQPDVP